MSQQTMSTNISDLPGPSEEDYEVNEEIYYDHPEPQNHNNNHNNKYDNEIRTSYNPREEDLYQHQEENVKMNIKKNIKEDFDTPSLFDVFKREISEENVLIFIILFLSTSHYADDYTRKLLSFLSFNVNTSNLTITLIKCALLLLIYIIVKNYILPYIKV